MISNLFFFFPLFADAGTCAAQEGNRCGVVSDDSTACSCTVECIENGDCCSDYHTICHDACPANTAETFVCRDGSTCDPMTHPDGYGCCRHQGGKLKCPSNLPYMCSGINQGIGAFYSTVCGDDHCCFASPYACDAVDRQILQDCPAKIGDAPSICPHHAGPNHMSDISFPQISFFQGSEFFRVHQAGANMEMRMDGKLQPRAPWEFCLPSNEPTKLVCLSGKTCDVETHELKWECCKEEGGRHKCPAEMPIMCKEKTCGADGMEHCCSHSFHGCGEEGALEQEQCPGSQAVALDLSVRLCSSNYPVLCNDSRCVATKSECEVVEKNCPVVPTCPAEDGVWEETTVGQVATSPCPGQDGVKTRVCGNTFVNGIEVVEWGPVQDACRDIQEKCAGTTTENGAVVPYMPVGAYFFVEKFDCPEGKDGETEGDTVYYCTRNERNELKHDIISKCYLPCTKAAYCNGHGQAITSLHDLSFRVGALCECKCDQGWSGPNCATGDADAIREAEKNLVVDGGKVPSPPKHHKKHLSRQQILTLILSYILLFLSVFALGYIVYVCISSRCIRKDEEEVAVDEDEDEVYSDDEENNEGISGIIKVPVAGTMV